MRRKEREITDHAALLDLLDKAAIIRLGLWDGKEVYVVPLNFVRKDETLFFHSAGTGRKLEILKSFPRVCFETEGPSSIDPGTSGGDCTTLYESLIGWGSVSSVEDENEKVEALISLNRKFGAGAGPFPADLVRRTAVLRIDIERMTGKANKGRM